MNRLKEVLREQGRMQTYLCREMNRTANTVSNWCNNRVQPSVQDLYQIAELLNCEVAELLVEKNKLKDKKQT
jgi:putative transcriptional regulator